MKLGATFILLLLSQGAFPDAGVLPASSIAFNREINVNANRINKLRLEILALIGQKPDTEPAAEFALEAPQTNMVQRLPASLPEENVAFSYEFSLVLIPKQVAPSK